MSYKWTRTINGFYFIESEKKTNILGTLLPDLINKLTSCSMRAIFYIELSNSIGIHFIADLSYLKIANLSAMNLTMIIHSMVCI